MSEVISCLHIFELKLSVLIDKYKYLKSVRWNELTEHWDKLHTNVRDFEPCTSVTICWSDASVRTPQTGRYETRVSTC